MKPSRPKSNAAMQVAVRLERLAWSRRGLYAVVVAAGLVVGVASLVVYVVAGYGRGMVVLWLAGLALLACGLVMAGERAPRLSRADVLACAGLVVVFAPLYLARTYGRPVQVNSDEVSIMTNAKAYAGRDGVDLFGVSDYLGHPAGMLVLFGKVGGWIGGVELAHMRLVHGALGLLVIAASYALVCQLLARRWALFAACVVGLSHSLVMISRMAMRENTAVLLEVVALALLLRGLREGHRLLSFVGGVVAGLGFYVYYPARFTVVIWALFLVAVAVFGRSAVSLRDLRRVAVATAMGFVLVATPILVAEQRAPPEQVALQRHALLIYPEARETQQGWVFASSEWEGVRKNFVWGLTAFNNRVVDQSYIYPNRSHGFLDPVSGILLWLGAIVVVVSVVRRRGERRLLLALGAFVILWLSFALLVNKAPNYTRLLVTLPFVAVLVTVAARFLAQRAVRLAGRLGIPVAARAGGVVAAGLLLLIAGANLAIAREFVDAGIERGDTIGDTGRYIEARRDDPRTTFYIATEDVEPYKYYDWGYPFIWKERLSIFAGDAARVGEVISPGALAEFEAPPPFVVFMRRELWDQAGPRLSDRYAAARIRNVVPDGSRIVLEVPAVAQ